MQNNEKKCLWKETSYLKYETECGHIEKGPVDKFCPDCGKPIEINNNKEIDVCIWTETDNPDFKFTTGCGMITKRYMSTFCIFCGKRIKEEKNNIWVYHKNPDNIGEYDIKIIDHPEISHKAKWNGEDWILPIDYPITKEVEAWKKL